MSCNSKTREDIHVPSEGRKCLNFDAPSDTGVNFLVEAKSFALCDFFLFKGVMTYFQSIKTNFGCNLSGSGQNSGSPKL